MNSSVFGKTVENVWKHREIKLVTNYWVSETSYYTTKFFIENLLATEMKKVQILMNKLDNLELSILELSKTVMYEL